MIIVEFLDFGDFRKILSMLSELAKLEPTASSEFYKVFLWRENEACVKKGHPPFLGRTCPIKLIFGMHKLEVLTQLSTGSTRPRTSPQSRAISTGSDPG